MAKSSMEVKLQELYDIAKMLQKESQIKFKYDKLRYLLDLEMNKQFDALDDKAYNKDGEILTKADMMNMLLESSRKDRALIKELCFKDLTELHENAEQQEIKPKIKKFIPKYVFSNPDSIMISDGVQDKEIYKRAASDARSINKICVNGDNIMFTIGSSPFVINMRTQIINFINVNFSYVKMHKYKDTFIFEHLNKLYLINLEGVITKTWIKIPDSLLTIVCDDKFIFASEHKITIVEHENDKFIKVLTIADVIIMNIKASKTTLYVADNIGKLTTYDINTGQKNNELISGMNHSHFHVNEEKNIIIYSIGGGIIFANLTGLACKSIAHMFRVVFDDYDVNPGFADTLIYCKDFNISKQFDRSVMHIIALD